MHMRVHMLPVILMVPCTFSWTEAALSQTVMDDIKINSVMAVFLIEIFMFFKRNSFKRYDMSFVVLVEISIIAYFYSLFIIGSNFTINLDSKSYIKKKPLGWLCGLFIFTFLSNLSMVYQLNQHTLWPARQLVQLHYKCINRLNEQEFKETSQYFCSHDGLPGHFLS